MTDTKDWFGKRGDFAPLPLEWFKSVSQPHSFDLHGEPLRALTPPQRKGPRSYAGLVLVCVAAGSLMIWAAFAMGVGR